MSISRTLVATLATTALAALAVVPHADGLPREGRSTAKPSPSYNWHITPTGSTDTFRGLAAVDRSTAWVSGGAGSVLRTTDRGETWEDVSPPDATGLRDIEAFGPERAVTLAIGPGEASRIYATADGGQTWTETFRNTEETAFYDCLALSSDGSGLALSDPVDGFFRLARTTDFGRTWSVESDAGMPAAVPGEFAFAASGTCIESGPQQTYWFATGGVDQPRVFRSDDGGQTWTVTTAPMRGGLSAGIYSIDARNARQLVIVGGDFAAEDDGSDAAATSRDGGESWVPSTTPVTGYRSGVAFLPQTGRTAIAVGPNGSDFSTDRGRTWTSFDGDWYHGIQCARDGACWASGTDGRVAYLTRS